VKIARSLLQTSGDSIAYGLPYLRAITQLLARRLNGQLLSAQSFRASNGVAPAPQSRAFWWTASGPWGSWRPSPDTRRWAHPGGKAPREPPENWWT